MEQDLVSICPRCNEKLIATRLKCNKCELELNGDFHLSKFDYLTSEELSLIESFLKAQGNFKTVQMELQMSYPALKKKFNEVLSKLNLLKIESEKRNEDIMMTSNNQPINNTDSLVVSKIKEKLNSCGGRATVALYNGDVCEIGFDSDGKGLVSPKIPIPNQLTWEVFDATIEVLIQNNGRVIKGKARSGAKLGSSELPLDSLEGYIAYKVQGVEIGKAAFGPGFVIAAILDWVGACNNERGYISIRPEFMIENND